VQNVDVYRGETGVGGEGGGQERGGDLCVLGQASAFAAGYIFRSTLSTSLKHSSAPVISPSTYVPSLGSLFSVSVVVSWDVV